MASFNISSTYSLNSSRCAASCEGSSPTKFSRSCRPVPTKLITVGKARSRAVQDVLDDYIKKVKRYCSFEEVQIRSNPKKSSEVKVQVEAEGSNVLKNISATDWVIVLDQNGKDITSEQFANLIADAGDKDVSLLVFCIGGPYGHGSEVKKRADMTIKLSSMVMNHQVVVIVLLEQLYRAWTILRGENYHH